MATHGISPWQTLGPFFDGKLIRDGDDDLTRRTVDGPQARGEVILIRGRVLEEGGDPVPGCLIEIWQANATGRYDHPADPATDRPLDPNFKGFGRALTGADGRYEFRTVKPGAVPAHGNQWQAPHILVSLFAAGLLRRLVTRLYFPDEPLNDADPILLGVDDAEARKTLIAKRVAGDPIPTYGFDIRLRGAGETAFFVD